MIEHPLDAVMPLKAYLMKKLNHIQMIGANSNHFLALEREDIDSIYDWSW